MNEPTVIDEILNDFLREQFTQAMDLASQSDLVTVTPLRGRPPTQYVVEFRCKGLAKDARDKVVMIDGPWGFGVNFPANYVRGGFHVADVVAYLGPVPRPVHPNLRPPFVCFEVRPAMPLTEIIYTLYDFLTWNLFSTHDEGLAHDSAQWYRNQNPNRFPIDRRPLKRRELNLTVKPIDPKS